MKPFFKSAGGKSWLVETLVPEILATKPTRYVEPFVGAGAIALAMPATLPKLLNDANPALVDAWLCLQRVPDVLYVELAKLYMREEGMSVLGRTALYLDVRAEFNAMATGPQQARSMWPARAARFLYLNARCFNGLWRTNSRGKFNVPCANYPAPRLLFAQELRELSKFLANATITLDSAMVRLYALTQGRVVIHRDLKPANPLAGTAIYIDPPYDGTFVGYTKDGFDTDDQRDLALAAGMARVAGAHVWLSNTDTEYVRELYRGWHIEALDEQHSVGAKGDRRGKKGCVLIRSHAVPVP